MMNSLQTTERQPQKLKGVDGFAGGAGASVRANLAGSHEAGGHVKVTTARQAQVHLECLYT